MANKTPTLLKRGRRLGAEYNTYHRRKAVIYKETWTPGKPRSFVPIPHKICIKTARAFPRKGRQKGLIAQSQGSYVAQFQRSHIAQFDESTVAQPIKGHIAQFKGAT